MEQKLTKEQCSQILEELREIKRIMATKEDIGKIEKKESREIKENMDKNKGNEDNREIKDIVEDICNRIGSMCHKMNEAILDAYGMPICRNVWRPFYCGEDGINSTRCSSTGYRY